MSRITLHPIQFCSHLMVFSALQKYSHLVFNILTDNKKLAIAIRHNDLETPELVHYHMVLIFL